MKKATFKITKGLKGFLACVALIGSLALGHTSPKGAAFAVVAPLGLVAGMKKKGINLEEGEEKLIAGMEEQLNAGIQKAFDEARNGLITAEDAQKQVEDKLKELSLTAKSITIPGTGKDGEADKTLDEMLRDYGTKLANNEKAIGSAAPVNYGAAVHTAVKELVGKVKATKAGGSDSPFMEDVEVKAAVSMTSTNTQGNASGVTVPANYMYGVEAQAAPDVRVQPYITQFIDNGSTSLASFPYADKLPTQGTMAITAEGALKPLLSVSIERRFSQAFKIAGRSKVTEEALDDIPGLESMVNGELRYSHDMAVQTAVYTHVAAFAPAFVAGDLAASTESANNYDAIRAAIYAVKIASKGMYVPNAVVVNSADAYAMGATKDSNKDYIMPPWVDRDGTLISGVRIVETTDTDNVPAGTFIVGDWRKIHRRTYKPFSLRMGQGIVGSATAANIVSDFESNMYTIIGESRLHLFHYKNDETAFIKTTFAAVKTAIETP